MFRILFLSMNMIKKYFSFIDLSLLSVLIGLYIFLLFGTKNGFYDSLILIVLSLGLAALMGALLKIPFVERLFNKYINLCRSLIPDHLYKFWLDAGVMDKDSYEIWQENGWIKSEDSADYIKKNNEWKIWYRIKSIVE